MTAACSPCSLDCDFCLDTVSSSTGSASFQFLLSFAAMVTWSRGTLPSSLCCHCPSWMLEVLPLQPAQPAQPISSTNRQMTIRQNPSLGPKCTILGIIDRRVTPKTNEKGSRLFTQPEKAGWCVDYNVTYHSRIPTFTNTNLTSGSITSSHRHSLFWQSQVCCWWSTKSKCPSSFGPNQGVWHNLEQPGPEPSGAPEARNTFNQLMRLGASWGLWVGLRPSVTEVSGLGSSHGYSWGGFLMASKKCSKQSGGHVDSLASDQRGCSVTTSLLKVAGHKGWFWQLSTGHAIVWPPTFSTYI